MITTITEIAVVTGVKIETNVTVGTTTIGHPTHCKVDMTTIGTTTTTVKDREHGAPTVTPEAVLVTTDMITTEEIHRAIQTIGKIMTATDDTETVHGADLTTTEE